MKNKYFNELVETFASLPTIGKKSALRFAYHLILKDKFLALKLANSLENAVKFVKKCSICNGLSENEICDICLDETKEEQTLCLVLHQKDIFTIEENTNYNGKYFVIEKVDEEHIKKLIDLVETKNINEIIFAFPPSVANEGLILLIEDKLKEFDIKFTKIAQGVPTGIDLENVDMLSLNKAIEQRIKI